MNKKLPFILSFFVLLLFTSCNVKKSISIFEPIEEKKVEEYKFSNVTIKVSFSTNIDDPRGQAIQLFKELVESKTENRIKIEIQPNGKIEEGKALSDTELIQYVISGKLDMTVSSAGNYASFVPQAGLSALPYLFLDFIEAWNYMDSDMIKNINTTFENKNMIVLSHFDNGFRCVTTSKNFGAIYKLDDLNGLNIRTPQNQIVMETMLALGAKPKSSSFTTLKEDILSGKFDAQENPIPVIYNSKLYEVQKYLSITNHSYDAMPLTIRKDLWDKLSNLDKLILQDSAEQAQNMNRKIVKEQTESYIKKLQDVGMIITFPNLEPFQKATKDVIDVFSPVYGEDIINKIKTTK